jgi:WS/DGAT/MGAT family acyltransferase
LRLEELRATVAARLPGLPPLRRQLVRRPRPGWLLHDTVDVSLHITERLVEPGATLEDAVDEVWSAPLPGDRPSWSMTLVRDENAGRAVLAMKQHHCQGDGISALGVLDRLLSADPADPLVERGRERGGAAAPRHGVSDTLRTTWRQGRRTTAGLWSLATRGGAPATPLNRQVAGPARRLVCVPLPAAGLRSAARAHRVRPHELAVTVAGAAIGSLLATADLAPASGRLRAMVPIAMRPPVLDRVFGNWTGSVAIDLPVGPMPFSGRLAAVRTELRTRAGRGEPDAGHAVMRVAGRMPPRLHGAFARWAYDRKFFNTIVSYLPGARGERWCAGARVVAACPVVPLAERVPLTVGVLVSGETVGVGVLLDAALPLRREVVADAVRDAFAAALTDGTG